MPSAPSCTAEPTAIQPLPTIAPVMACVVEIGRPRTLATSTVRAAPTTIATRYGSELARASGTRPLPENRFRSASARAMAASEPAAVVAVAHASATL